MPCRAVLRYDTIRYGASEIAGTSVIRGTPSLRGRNARVHSGSRMRTPMAALAFVSFYGTPSLRGRNARVHSGARCAPHPMYIALLHCIRSGASDTAAQRESGTRNGTEREAAPRCAEAVIRFHRTDAQRVREARAQGVAGAQRDKQGGGVPQAVRSDTNNNYKLNEYY